MESACFKFFTKKKKTHNYLQHPQTCCSMLCGLIHKLAMLWKAADHQGPPNESAYITHFGCEVRDDIPIPVIAQGDPAPQELINVIQCQCRTQGKKCSTEACGCHKQHLSCTSFCNCLVMRVVAIHTQGSVMFCQTSPPQ